MITATIAAFAILTAAPASLDDLSTRDRALWEPRPWPAQRVDSPDRAENGRLWHSSFPIGNRTPLAQQWYGRHGAAAYGAPADLNNHAIYARIVHTPIAISPWQTYGEDGMHNYRQARNIWLREQGWVLKVRTHVNPLYHAENVSNASLPTPSATIELHRDPSAPTFPSKMRVEAPETRTFRPITAAPTGPFRVIEPTTPDATVAEAETAQD